MTVKLIIVSGLSGSGKSIALATLEDCGFYCIDNLPVALLESFASQIALANPGVYQKTAIAIDARNQSNNLALFPQSLAAVKKLGLECEILFLQADHDTLLKRYSETRRKHPLTDSAHSLGEAIELERSLLQPVANEADLTIDTSHTNMHQLRGVVRARLGNEAQETLSLFFQSFGYKHGIPLDTDFVFDARCLPNPHWELGLRELTGRDAAVAKFLEHSADVRAYLADLVAFLDRWIPRFEAENRSYLTIAIGCTGGQHRSVYLAEALNRHFQGSRYNVLLRHRELA
ncbi:nucleotide-binding protein [Methylogaea oryzae]|uniref:Nucleotide-binding protein n=1 Tax=Methylogaea oryzae TaxID=1295382 RepID=A0A8D4VPX4_9GAMM|nr:nucleotide-binding protein [Methylogaea oryzae]